VVNVISVRRAGDRFETRTDWLTSRHSFSFGRHYDPADTHFGLLLVNNDDVVAPGTGFETHPHRDMEIVTWVLRGALVHQDSEGHSGVIYPGLAQRMSAGRGILHSEKNDSWRLTGAPEHREPVRFVQMWVHPDEAGTDPGYEQLEIADDLLRAGGLVTVASGRPGQRDEAAIRIRQKDATLHAARLAPGAVVRLPAAPFVHLYVPQGSVMLEGAGAGAGAGAADGGPEVPGAGARVDPGVLREGDAARVEDAQGQRVTAGPDGAEILVWEMHAPLR
jgi:redox-sensitive bicupin YhaK (pirin superfamily)